MENSSVIIVSYDSFKRRYYIHDRTRNDRFWNKSVKEFTTTRFEGREYVSDNFYFDTIEEALEDAFSYESTPRN